jgi:hypothetical protein
MREQVQAFDAYSFTTIEQQALLDGNLATLSDDSPVRHLLERGVRPKLDPADIYDYGSGVLAAVGALRAHLYTLSQAGYDFAEPTIDSTNPPNFENLAPAHSKLGGLALSLLAVKRQQVASLKDAVGRAASYFGDERHIAISGFFGGNLQIRGLPFVSEMQVQRGGMLPFWQGVSDSLRLYYALYQQQGVAGHRSPVTYSLQASRHFFPRKDDTWPQAGLNEPQHFASGPDHHLDHYTVPGYSAFRDGEQEVTVLWNSEVPSGAQLTRVCSFAGYSMLVTNSDGRPPQSVDVGVHSSMLNARLRPGTALIVQGKDENLFVLEHPFKVDDTIVRPNTGTVSLIRVCQYKQYFDLADDCSQPEILDYLTEQSLAGQRWSPFRKLDHLIFHSDLAIIPAKAGVALTVGNELHRYVPVVHEYLGYAVGVGLVMLMDTIPGIRKRVKMHMAKRALAAELRQR